VASELHKPAALTPTCASSPPLWPQLAPDFRQGTRKRRPGARGHMPGGEAHPVAVDCGLLQPRLSAFLPRGPSAPFAHLRGPACALAPGPRPRQDFGGGSTGPDQIFPGITRAPPSAPGRGRAQSPARRDPNPQTTEHEAAARSSQLAARGFSYSLPKQGPSPSKAGLSVLNIAATAFDSWA
jgi:hypothetical protein